MALVKCPDCGKEHSDSAATCPNCGRPNKTVAKQQEPIHRNKFGCGAGCLALIVLLGVLYAIGKSSNPSASPPVDLITPAVDAVPQLEVQHWTWGTEYGYATAEGTVKNISGESLKNVEAVISFCTKDGTFVKSDDAIIECNPILPGQTSPFKVMSSENPAATRARLEFKSLFGGTINYRERQKSGAKGKP